MTIIMLNIIIANESDSYATTILEGPVIYRQERISVAAELCAIESIHKIPLSQNINMLIAKRLSCRSVSLFGS